MFDRRLILKGLISFGTVPLVLPPSAPDRYQRLVFALTNLRDGVLRDRETYQVYFAQIDPALKNEIRTRATALFDELGKVLLGEFDSPVTAEGQAAIPALFRVRENGLRPDEETLFGLDLFDEESLRRHEDGVVVVATTNYVLSRLRAPINSQKSVAFHGVAKRYKAFILGCVEA